ncbi:MAG: hypothetical protein NTZ10_04360 [Candidatus Saganbacteria bacterium]|nr:hypothetical protein [Candidatus Saganbacteria bacterium]
MAIQLLVEALNAKGHKIGLIDAEPGYPFFMRAMGETTAAAAVENTCHFFLAPNTNPLFGAPISYPGVQGGDDAALALIYLLAAAKHQWQGRNPVQQLDWMRQEFGIPPTIIREFKPGLPQEYALKKYDVAEAMKTYVKKELEPTRNYKVDYMVSGVGVQSLKTKATVLVRFSNTGPTFTTSGEALSREDSDQAFKLGASIMEKGVKAAGVENVFLWKDLAPFKP